MLYYLLFWTLLGFIIHFYIIFGTNLLTGGPAQNCCFLLVLGFRRKGISNGVQTEWNLRQHDFLEEYDLGYLEFMSEDPWGGQEIGGVPYRGAISWGPLELLDLHSKLSGSDLFQKSRSRRFHSVLTPFDIPFLRNTETGNKTAIWAGPPVSRLVQKVI